jgi:hypothetical protein
MHQDNKKMMAGGMEVDRGPQDHVILEGIHQALYGDTSAMHRRPRNRAHDTSSVVLMTIPTKLATPHKYRERDPSENRDGAPG